MLPDLKIAEDDPVKYALLILDNINKMHRKSIDKDNMEFNITLSTFQTAALDLAYVKLNSFVENRDKVFKQFFKDKFHEI